MSVLIISTFFAFTAFILWLFAGLSLNKQRPYSWALVCLAVVIACIAFVIYGLFYSASVSYRPRLAVEVVLQYTIIPLFFSLPLAFTFGLTQTLIRLKVRSIVARIVSVLGGLCMTAILPFALISAGCGLAGACF